MGRTIQISDLNVLKDNLEKIGDLMVKELAKELIGQGHKATGNLINSIEYAVETKINELSLEVEYLSYGLIVEDGVKAAKVPYKRGSGAKSSQYIDGLIQWVKTKGMATEDAAAKSIAFAIANTHKKDTHDGYGIPSAGSFKYSNNGRRLRFQSFVLEQNISKIEQMLNDNIVRQIDLLIDQFISKIAA